jgi:hypothetical protein
MMDANAIPTKPAIVVSVVSVTGFHMSAIVSATRFLTGASGRSSRNS